MTCAGVENNHRLPSFPLTSNPRSAVCTSIGSVCPPSSLRVCGFHLNSKYPAFTPSACTPCNRLRQRPQLAPHLHTVHTHGQGVQTCFACTTATDRQKQPSPLYVQAEEWWGGGWHTSASDACTDSPNREDLMTRKCVCHMRGPAVHLRTGVSLLHSWIPAGQWERVPRSGRTMSVLFRIPYLSS